MIYTKAIILLNYTTWDFKTYGIRTTKFLFIICYMFYVSSKSTKTKDFFVKTKLELLLNPS